MSTTSSSALADPKQRLAPTDVFDALVWQSPEICNDCFAHIRDRTEHDAGADRLGTGNRPTETLERAGVGVIGQDAEDCVAFGATPRYFARTFCGECGRPGGRARDEQLTSQEAVDRVGTLLDRLDGADVAVDADAVYALVREAKSRPTLQGADTEIFRRAVALGVRRGRRSR